MELYIGKDRESYEKKNLIHKDNMHMWWLWLFLNEVVMLEEVMVRIKGLYDNIGTMFEIKKTEGKMSNMI